MIDITQLTALISAFRVETGYITLRCWKEALQQVNGGKNC